MCVIAYKPYNVAVPSEDVLLDCFESNPNGAGLAIIRPHSTEVEIHKGFMSFDDFMSFASTAVTQYDVAAYHFRITTAGGTSPFNCHPFPVSSDVKDLTALEIKSRFALLHNGILGKGDEAAHLSDTQLYVRDKLAPRHMESIASERKRVEKETAGSRVLLMDGKTHEVSMLGTGWIADHEIAPGMYFSNDSYLGWSYPWHYKGKKKDKGGDRYGRDAVMSWDEEMPCPNCMGDGVTLVSYNHDLFECMDCGALFDAEGHRMYLTYNKEASAYGYDDE